MAGRITTGTQWPHVQRGFSLVGIMISMVLGLFLLAGMFQMFLNNKESFRFQVDQSQIQERGRFVVDQLTQDLKRAGYYGGNAELSMISGSLAQIDGDDECERNDNSWGRKLQQTLFGIDGRLQPAALASYACLPDYIDPNSDVITLRHASPWQVTLFERDRPYIRTALFEGRMFLGRDEADADNVVADQVQRTHELIAHAYFVGQTDESCQGENIPGLYRIGLDANGRPEARLLALGVERLRFLYGLDLDGDGTVDRHANAADVADWATVASVRLWLLVRSECPDPRHLDDRSYAVGDDVVRPQDRFRRQLFTSTITLRNRS